MSLRSSCSFLGELKDPRPTPPTVSPPRAKQTNSHFWQIPKPPLSCHLSSSSAIPPHQTMLRLRILGSPDRTHPGPVCGSGGSSSAVSRWAQRAQCPRTQPLPAPDFPQCSDTLLLISSSGYSASASSCCVILGARATEQILSILFKVRTCFKAFLNGFHSFHF